MSLHVEGFQNLQRAFKQADRDIRLGQRKALLTIAEPVKRDAQTLAGTRIRRMPLSPRWAEMRSGATQKSLYVMPKQRGLKQGAAKRPKLAPLMMTRAMDPALDRNKALVRREFQQLLDTMAARFNRA